MCFRQGKACVYASEEDGTIIIVAPPGGMVERLNTGADQITDSGPTVANAKGTGHQPLIPKMTIVIGGNGAGKTTWCRQYPHELPTAFYNPDADRPGPRRLEQRPESARSRPDCERRDPEAPRTERGLRFREHLFGTFPAQDRTRGRPRTGTPSGRCSLARAEPRSTSSACVNASGLAPDTTSRSRRSRGGGQQLRRTLPKTAASLGAIDALDNSHGVTRHVARITRGEIWLPATPTPAWARTLIRQIEPHRPTT